MLWICTGLADDVVTDDAALAEQNLAEVRSRITELEQEFKKQSERRGATERELQKAERSESGLRRKLSKTNEQLTASRERLKSLQSEAADRRTEVQAYRVELEEQLRLAYVAGQDGWLQMVLSQRDPIRIGRELVYYSYIARQRSELMDVVRGKLEKLEKTAISVEREEARLSEIQQDQRARIQEISQAREERHLALADINQGIASQNDQIARLRQEAESLESLVDELTRMLASLPIENSSRFVDRKGQMDWPAEGRLTRKFGQSKADGHLRWDGVLLAAGAGTEVRAVHHGRVVFSDWLSGMGLLVVVEHGDGYLTLYGHNQDVVREVGEWVEPGSVVAHVGDSGGQATTGLYFEIRKQGQPVDPTDYISSD
ncbi:MAG: peptidoglycan DD-metalloendopeptidase family protein [Gammaproteobacteria bacterium]|nr:peptidoglycan DD-metalloendopeptidase family protein [Gammaproteobacteria bacterium]